MECKINLPKEQMDKILLDQIAEMKRENAKLKRMLERANTATAYTDRQREEIKLMYKDFTDLVAKYADHEDCRD